MTGEVYVAEPRPSRPTDEADTYHTDEGCRTLARAADYHAVSPASTRWPSRPRWLTSSGSEGRYSSALSSGCSG